MTTALKEKLRQFAFVRFILVGYRFLRKIFWRIRGYIRLMKISRRKGEVWLELGAGSKPGTGNWVTIDINGQCDVCYNLAKGVPFTEGSVSRIYSSHMFEHLTPTEASICMRECLRVLKIGGEFSIAVPNARLYIDAYLQGDRTGHLLQVLTPIDYLNYTAYCGGAHKNMFDPDSLCHLLRSAGLINVSMRLFDPTVDLEIRRWESIYAKGYKA